MLFFGQKPELMPVHGTVLFEGSQNEKPDR
jgi:hypothetical protein